MFALLMAILFSCNKPNTDKINPPANGKNIFFDIWGEDKTISGQNQISSFRIGYDIDSKNIIWKKKNENLEAINKLGKEFYGFPKMEFTESFIYGNSLIRIFADRNTNGSTSFGHSTSRNGVFLEKIDIATGNRISFINLLPSTSFISGSSVFDMSKVVYDGTNFYFGCVDGKLYCFNSSGNMLWSKPDYSPIVHENELALLYLHDNRLYYISRNNKIICINTKDGNEIWAANYSSNQITGDNYQELGFSTTKLFVYSDYGISRFLLNNGQYEGFCYSYSTERITALPVTLDDSVAFAFNRVENTIVLTDEVRPNAILLQFLNTKSVINKECKIYDRNLFGWGINTYFLDYEIEFASINYYTGNINWSLKGYYTGNHFDVAVYNYFFYNNSLFIIGNFYIQNGSMKKYDANTIVGPGPYGYANYGNAVGLIELNASNGQLISQNKIFSDSTFSILYCYRNAIE